MSRGLDPVTVTLIGGIIVSVIGTIVTGTVTIITALRVTATAKDTEAIKGHVNSEKTAAEGREATLRLENKMLREQIDENKLTAALLAQAAAQTPQRDGLPAPTTGERVRTMDTKPRRPRRNPHE